MNTAAKSIWCSGNAPTAEAQYQGALQDDGNLVIIEQTHGKVVWATNTSSQS
jgi:hypothetical protein